jgi:hypothetical protein
MVTGRGGFGMCMALSLFVKLLLVIDAATSMIHVIALHLFLKASWLVLGKVQGPALLDLRTTCLNSIACMWQGKT